MKMNPSSRNQRLVIYITLFIYLFLIYYLVLIFHWILNCWYFEINPSRLQIKRHSYSRKFTPFLAFLETSFFFFIESVNVFAESGNNRSSLWSECDVTSGMRLIRRHFSFGADARCVFPIIIPQETYIVGAMSATCSHLINHCVYFGQSYHD